MVAIAMVAKTFGVYSAQMFTNSSDITVVNSFAVGILLTFMFINLAGASIIAKSENIIVVFKLSILVLFTIIAFFYIKPELLSIKDAPPAINIFSSIALTFFAYEGFRVITNTAEDMKDPSKLMLKSMTIAILLVMVLYVAVTFAVFGNLPLEDIIKAKDYALAEAAKPAFGEKGFVIMAIAALVSTASSINANLYAVTNVTYQMAVNGELPKVYERNVWHSTQGLVISTIILIVFVLFFNLTQIAAIGSISILFIHALVHIGHLFKIKKTQASKFLVGLAIVGTFLAIGLALSYTSKHIPTVGYYIAGGFFVAFLIEVSLRLITKRVIKKQTGV